MNTGRKGEEFVKDWYHQKHNIVLFKMPKGEKGFDFRDKRRKLYVEVKGTTARKLSDVLFRYFTNAQHEKAKWCKKNKSKYWIHLIIGIGTLPNWIHYRIPGKELITQAKAEVAWAFPIRKEMKKYLVK